MPCTAKKFEAGRPEMGRDGRQDIDAVLTTRELAELIRMHGLDLAALPPDAADTPFGERTSAGKLFGASGGVAEAAVRTAHYLLTGETPASSRCRRCAASTASRSSARRWPGARLASRRSRASATRARLLEQVRAGRTDLQFIEVMTCAGRLHRRRRPAAGGVAGRGARAHAGALR